MSEATIPEGRSDKTKNANAGMKAAVVGAPVKSGDALLAQVKDHVGKVEKTDKKD